MVREIVAFDYHLLPTVPCIVPSLAALVTCVPRIEGSSSWSSASVITSSTTSLTIGHLDLGPTSTYGTPIKCSNCILCVPWILELDEGKSRWTSCHPDASEWTEITECFL